MHRIMARIQTLLRGNSSSRKRAAHLFTLATLLVTSGGCFEQSPVKPIEIIPGGEGQMIPSNRAIMSSPTPGSRLANNQTFEWNPGTDVDYYTLEFHGSNDDQDLLARFDAIQGTSYTVLVQSIEERSVLWVKLTTHHVNGQVSEPYWCEYWYPAQDQGMTLDHLEVSIIEWWRAGGYGERVIYENMNESRMTRQFTPEPLNAVWDGGHKRVDLTMSIHELPDFIPSGEQGAFRSSAQCTISSSGLGFSRGARLDNQIDGNADNRWEGQAENRSVSFDSAVGPMLINAGRERILFEAEAGLDSINDSKIRIRVIAVYRQTAG